MDLFFTSFSTLTSLIGDAHDHHDADAEISISLIPTI
jgi:hypothetical protein